MASAEMESPSRKRLHQSAVLVILVIHSLLLGGIAATNAPVFDEIAHLPSGLSHWLLGDFDLYRVNPPLMRMIASIPLLIMNPECDWMVSHGPYDRPEFEVGNRFMHNNSKMIFWYFTLCRWMQIPVSMFGGWICYRWATELYGHRSGFLALILWSFCPNTLAWGATITPDIGATSFGVAAGYAFWRWMKAANWPSALIAGLALGLSLLSKSTWIILLGLWPLLWGVQRVTQKNGGQVFLQIKQLVCILSLGLYLLNLGYGFEKSFQPLESFEFISQALGGLDSQTTPGNRFRQTWQGHVPIPLPANYLQGIDVQKYDFERGKWSYLRGEHKVGGWWYYYLYAFLVKSTMGSLLLGAIALGIAGFSRNHARCGQKELVLLAPALVVLALVSSQVGFNRYLRYALPIIPFVYIFISGLVQRGCRQRGIASAFCVLAVVGGMIESLSIYPHSMSFFNLAVGGPLNGPRHLLDANIDWGQDLLQLKRFLQRHPDVQSIRLAFYGAADPKLAGFHFETFSIPESASDESRNDQEWYAVSVNHIYGYRRYDGVKQELDCFQKRKPDAMAGYSIYLYLLSRTQLMEMLK